MKFIGTKWQWFKVALCLFFVIYGAVEIWNALEAAPAWAVSMLVGWCALCLAGDISTGKVAITFGEKSGVTFEAGK